MLDHAANLIIARHRRAPARPSVPWLSPAGLGRLPGDFHVQRGGSSFYFPLTTSLVVSVIVTLDPLAAAPLN